jgi:short-chain fatty acids transporter
MKFIERYADWFKRFLPSPFSIAIVLTLVTMLLVMVTSEDPGDIIIEWQAGLWNEGLLAFAFQMMLMLVLGHVLALSNFFNTIVHMLLQPIKTNAQAAFVVSFATILVAFFNWGLALIFGAILARKVGEQFTRNNKALNYPLIGAAGYVGLMVWHGGISGSSLIKAAEPGHIRTLANNAILPEAIPYSETVFSIMNMVTFISLLALVPLVLYLIAKKSKAEVPNVKETIVIEQEKIKRVGAERIDYMWGFSKTIGMLMAAYALYIAVSDSRGNLGFITPNYINFCLLAACFWLHKNFAAFLSAVNEAIKGASGILIQFPLYFGILAMMQTGGLIEIISNSFIAVSNEVTLPIFTFITSGIVNIFVPSGGGQWAIQGPILIEAGNQIGVPLHKMIMALAYGDQVTNMLQPFWALPLLSITGLKAKQILPYTLIMFLVGGAIFTIMLLLF